LTLLLGAGDNADARLGIDEVGKMAVAAGGNWNDDAKWRQHTRRQVVAIEGRNA
jgi:hypothetical protein